MKFQQSFCVSAFQSHCSRDAGFLVFVLIVDHSEPFPRFSNICHWESPSFDVFKMKSINKGMVIMYNIDSIRNNFKLIISHNHSVRINRNGETSKIATPILILIIHYFIIAFSSFQCFLASSSPSFIISSQLS